MKVHPLTGVALTACALALAAALGIADDAGAAADVKNAGKNVGQTLQTWSKWLFGGTTAIMACGALLARKVAQAMVFAGMALMLGAFVFAPDLIADVAESLPGEVFK